jgi:hypothetical protein
VVQVVPLPHARKVRAALSDLRAVMLTAVHSLSVVVREGRSFLLGLSLLAGRERAPRLSLLVVALWGVG